MKNKWTAMAMGLAVVMCITAGAVPAGSTGDVYTLGTCPVSGEKLGSMGDAIVKDYDGQEVRFCCKGCVGQFEKDQATFLSKIDEAMAAHQLEDYPLETCVISGEKLGSMGEPVDVVHNNRLVRLCCKGCVKAFEKDPGASMAKLDQAVIAQQTPGYGLDTCVVSGQALGSMGDPVDYVVGTQLVRFCCQGCVKKFESDPASYLKKIPAYGSEPKADHEGSGSH